MDRHQVDFTEGPLEFRLTAGAIEIPPELLDPSSGVCQLAILDCTDPSCPGSSMGCTEGDPCLVRIETTLAREVNLDYAYDDESLRVDSVRLEEISASVMAATLDAPVEQVRILWAPLVGTSGSAQELAVLGPIAPGQSASPLEPGIDGQGLAGLESHLVTYRGFTMFVTFVTALEPGSVCPEGDLDLEISLRFLLTGEPLM